jgi:hypothetical protein
MEDCRLSIIDCSRLPIGHPMTGRKLPDDELTMAGVRLFNRFSIVNRQSKIDN